MTGSAPLAWSAYLDALEEWTRRVDAGVRGGDEPAPFDAEPDGPMPAELTLRAQALLERMRQLGTTAQRRRRELDRARSYEQD